MNNTKRIKAILKELNASDVKIVLRQSNKYPSAFSLSIPLYSVIHFRGNLDLLNNAVLKGIVAHELVHIRKKDLITTWILPFILMAAGLVTFSVSHLYQYLAFVIIILIAYFWLSMYVEHRADLLAAKAIGKATIIKAIIRLDALGLKSVWPHGNLKSRIKRINGAE